MLILLMQISLGLSTEDSIIMFKFEYNLREEDLYPTYSFHLNLC